MTTYDLCKLVIERKTYKNKEDMMIKLDIFLMGNRITKDQYLELNELLAAQPEDKAN